MFMQAGFAFLEIGFSRGKNAGTVVAKILTNFSIAALVLLGRRVRLRVRWRRSDTSSATPGSSCATTAIRRRPFPIMGFSDATIESKWLLPVRLLRASRWRSSGARRSSGSSSASTSSTRSSSRRSSTRSSRTGSSAVAGCRPTSACRTSPARRRSTSSARPARSPRCCCSAPRKGKYGPDGKPRAIPGHNMPLFGLGVLILLARLVRVQPGLDAERARRPLRGGRARHAPRGRRRRPRRDHRRRT